MVGKQDSAAVRIQDIVAAADLVDDIRMNWVAVDPEPDNQLEDNRAEHQVVHSELEDILKVSGGHTVEALAERRKQVASVDTAVVLRVRHKEPVGQAEEDSGLVQVPRKDLPVEVLVVDVQPGVLHRLAVVVMELRVECCSDTDRAQLPGNVDNFPVVRLKDNLIKVSSFIQILQNLPA